MKIRITNYSFSPGAANVGNITFTSYSSISLDAILVISNVTSGKIIYNFADSLLGGSVSDNILTLDCDTSSMNSSDKLTIYYDDNNITATDDTLQNSNDLLNLLKRMVKLMESSGTVDSNNRQRVVVESLVAPTTNVTLSSNSNGIGIATIIQNAGNPLTLGSTLYPLAIYEGPVDQRWRIIDAARTSFSVGIRAKLV